MIICIGLNMHDNACVAISMPKDLSFAFIRSVCEKVRMH